MFALMFGYFRLEPMDDGSLPTLDIQKAMFSVIEKVKIVFYCNIAHQWVIII